jgi:hypothetical protein
MSKDNPIYRKNIAEAPCACHECKNTGSIALEMKVPKRKSLFCIQCATDLLWHGVATEINVDELSGEAEGS